MILGWNRRLYHTASGRVVTVLHTGELNAVCSIALWLKPTILMRIKYLNEIKYIKQSFTIFKYSSLNNFQSSYLHGLTQISGYLKLASSAF